MRFKKTTTITLLLACSVNSALAPAAERDWQTAMLQNPSAAQRAIEQRGRVFIYDGVRQDDVDRAMDTQFERLENMMFIRIQRATATGEVEPDDDC